MPAKHSYPGSPAKASRADRDTEEIARDANLLKAGALQAAIVNSANFSSIATDENGVIQVFNPGAQRMLGYTAAEVVGKMTPAGFSDPLELMERASALTAELTTPIAPGFEALAAKASLGLEDIYELTYVRSDGSRFPALVSVTALRDARSAIIGYLLIGTDNTARKSAEAAVLLANRHLFDQDFYSHLIAATSSGPLLTTDANGIITDVNRPMEIVTGHSREELIGSPFRNSFTDPVLAEHDIQRAMTEGTLTEVKLTAQAPDGRQTVLSCNARTFHDRDHKVQGVFASARDITEQTRFERELFENNADLERVRAAAEQAGFARADLLASLSHKLRSPLNTILGFAQLIDSDTPPPTLAQTASVEQILRAGWYLLDLITEILDFAQIDSGKLVLSIQPTSVTEVLRECEGLVRGLARTRNITISYPASTLPYFADADRSRLKDILVNLITNAIKFNKKDGTVVVGCSFVAHEHGIPKRVRITVRDNGPGLPVARLSKVFQPFSRPHPERGTQESSGVSLAVSKRLVELMGGSIGAESRVGAGSMFWVELNATVEPLRALETAQHRAVAQTQIAEGTRRRTILHVEDDAAHMRLVKQLLSRQLNIHLLSAMDGQVAIEMARANLPDVILMDINLPGISGVDALNVLRADPATARIPIVALSANVSSREIEEGLKAGFFAYITKPFKFDELMETLDLALAHAARQVAPGK
jgi:PAS domain S-box-containing protein